MSLSPIKAPVVSLTLKLYPHRLLLVGSRNCLFHNQTEINEYKLAVWYTQLLVYGIPSCWFMVYPTVGLWYTQLLVYGIPSCWFMVYPAVGLWYTQLLVYCCVEQVYHVSICCLVKEIFMYIKIYFIIDII